MQYSFIQCIQYNNTVQRGQKRETLRAKWPFCPPEKAKSTDASSEMAMLPSRKGRIDRRLERNGQFALQRRQDGKTLRVKWPLLPSRQVKIDTRLERNGHFALQRGAKSRDASGEMAIFPASKGRMRGTLRANWPFCRPRRAKTSDASSVIAIWPSRGGAS